MSEKIRQGNDIRISWSLIDEDEQPYNLEGRNIAIELHTGKKKVRIKEHSVSGNTVFFTYYGKDQKYIGSYNLVFIENDGQVDMVTFDTKDAFTLVEHSWLAIDEGETPETIQLEFVTVTSELTERIGPPGAAAGFGTVDADVDDTLGPPSVDVETSGPNTAKNIHFSFHGLMPEIKTLAGMPLTGSGDVVKEITTDVGRQYVYFTGVQNSATVLLVNRGNILYLIKINSAGKWCTISAFGSPSDIARAGDKVYYKLGGGLILYVGDSYSSGISFITLINHSSHEVEATTLSSLPSGYTECAINTVASKDYVDNAIATSSATFLGTSAVGLSKAQFLAWAGTLNADLNDYCYWDTVDSIGNQIYKRYKYDGSQWLFEYSISVNEFSAEQMAAINSGIDAEKVAQISKKVSVAITSNAPVLQFYPNAPFTAIIGSDTGALALVEFDGTNPFIYDFRGNVIKAGKRTPTFGIELPNGNYSVVFLTGGSVSNVYADNNRYSGSELFDVVTVYSKPASGIPATDLAAAVQTSLGKADTAAQTHVLNWSGNNKITGIGDALRANAGDVVILTGDGLWDVIQATGDGDRGLFVDSIYYDDPEDEVYIHAFGSHNIALSLVTDGEGNVDTDSIHVFDLKESDLPLYLGVYVDENEDLVISNASAAMSHVGRPKFVRGNGLLTLLAETIEPDTTPNNTPFPVLDISRVDIERLGEPVEYIAVTFAYTFGLEDLRCYRLYFNSSTYVYDSFESVKFSGMYQKPNGGIPSSDLASAVQTSLGKADTAIQNVKTLAGQELTGSGDVVKSFNATGIDNPWLKFTGSGLALISMNGEDYVSLIRCGADKSLINFNYDFQFKSYSGNVYVGEVREQTKVLILSNWGSVTVEMLDASDVPVSATSITPKNLYSKPSTGIPKTDLASAVQTSLGKADSAVQSVKTFAGQSLTGTGDVTQSVTCTSEKPYLNIDSADLPVRTVLLRARPSLEDEGVAILVSGNAGIWLYVITGDWSEIRYDSNYECYIRYATDSVTFEAITLTAPSLQGAFSVSAGSTASSYTNHPDHIVPVYYKPSSGIPKSHLASAVQTSLGKADSALQGFMLDWGTNDVMSYSLVTTAYLAANRKLPVFVDGNGMRSWFDDNSDYYIEESRSFLVESIVDWDDYYEIRCIGFSDGDGIPIVLTFECNESNEVENISVSTYDNLGKVYNLWWQDTDGEPASGIVSNEINEAIAANDDNKIIRLYGSGLTEYLTSHGFSNTGVKYVIATSIVSSSGYIISFSFAMGGKLYSGKLTLDSGGDKVSDELSECYVKPSTGIPAADLASGVIPDPEVFVATYGTTTAAEITAAVTAGKIPICDYNGTRHYYVGLQTYSNVNYHYFYSPSSTNVIKYVRVKVSDNGWYASGGTLQLTSYLVSTLSGNESDTTKYPNCKAVYDEVHPAVVTTQPANGMLPNVVYNLGTLSGNTTFALASPSDANVVNHYYWTFDTSSTAPTITWPSGLSWYGGSAPTINASKHYEISVLNGIAVAMEV